jgi:SAM-dependent methyltransferase
VFAWIRRRRVRSGLAHVAPLPPPPWEERYGALHKKLVSYLLDSRDVERIFANGEPLPSGYGIGLDERVVEYPWLFSQVRGGVVLDAGSTLNHEHVLDRFLTRIARLHIMTLAPERVSFPERGVSYVYGDLRDIPYQDGSFDVVAAISTLEHIGMDTRIYGVASAPSADPAAEVRKAVRELLRVLRREGTFLVTVPYGAREDHGWFRQLDRGDVDTLVSCAAPRRAAVSVYRYTRRGWQLSSLDEAAGVSYYDHHADRRIQPDRAAAARAVACLRFGPPG